MAYEHLSRMTGTMQMEDMEHFHKLSNEIDMFMYNRFGTSISKFRTWDTPFLGIAMRYQFVDKERNLYFYRSGRQYSYKNNDKTVTDDVDNFVVERKPIRIYVDSSYSGNNKEGISGKVTIYRIVISKDLAHWKDKWEELKKLILEVYEEYDKMCFENIINIDYEIIREPIWLEEYEKVGFTGRTKPSIDNIDV